jgi:hypothetical protein
MLSPFPHRLRVAVNRLVKNSLLTTECLESFGFSTKYKIGEGCRAEVEIQ